MTNCDTLIRRASVLDGSGEPARTLDVAVRGDRIFAIGTDLRQDAETIIDAEGLCLSPGFIDAHTHDDNAVLQHPEMPAKISQGVTTVVVGNCGISAAPFTVRGPLPDPMNLLGEAAGFRFPAFAAYREAVETAQPAVNVAALVGHTTLRSNHMDRLDRAASGDEIAAMRAQLREALACGAVGLSTGLAYLSAHAATTEEVLGVAQPLAEAGAIYATHMRSETEGILDAMQEAFAIGKRGGVPVVISHLKCAGIDNWGRSAEVLAALDAARDAQPVGCDCYPYAAGSSTLDLRQVDERVTITITWSDPHPSVAGKTLAEVAASWHTTQIEAASRLQPAGAIYYSIAEADMRSILQHPATMIGSDGLPHDPRPHPRLWGTFPRILGRYSREEKSLSLEQAVHKMTLLPARRFALDDRGIICEGSFADLVLFNPATIMDKATFADPVQPSEGIHGVWVNGVLTWTGAGATGPRGGRFVPRGRRAWD